MQSIYWSEDTPRFDKRRYERPKQRMETDNNVKPFTVDDPGSDRSCKEYSSTFAHDVVISRCVRQHPRSYPPKAARSGKQHPIREAKGFQRLRQQLQGLSLVTPSAHQALLATNLKGAYGMSANSKNLSTERYLPFRWCIGDWRT